MKPQLIRYFIVSLFIFVVIVCFNIIVNYSGNEGFNPSDDGVVIAQSYRILNGEVPHKDFISIRPVGSGILHTVHFFMPLPLVQSTRAFVIAQCFLIALLISVILKSRFEEDIGIKIGILQFIFFLIFVYTLTVLDYTLYPWTTIDALMFALLAFSLVILQRTPNAFSQLLALIFICISALCRQTFVLVAAFFFIGIFVYNIKNKTVFRGLILSVVGALPIIFYTGFLIYVEGFGDFISQMTGRTELLETGVVQYGKFFIKSLGLPIHLMVIILFTITRFKTNLASRLKQLLRRKAYFISNVIFLYMFGIILFHFFDGKQNIYYMPFELFWLAIDILLLSLISISASKATRITALFVLILAWTSSISLGDNSPIFASGLLAAVILYFSLTINKIQILKEKEESLGLLIFGGLVMLFVCMAGYYSQRNWNYRDLPASELTFELEDVNENFGRIVTNENTGSYYSELNTVFASLPAGINKTVVMPNNAIFYPLFSTINPMPLDWIQPAEYAGQDERVFKAIKDLCNKPGYYFIIDKIDSKNMAFRIVPLNFDKYAYMEYIFNNCVLLQIESDYFYVYQTRM